MAVGGEGSGVLSVCDMWMSVCDVGLQGEKYARILRCKHSGAVAPVLAVLTELKARGTGRRGLKGLRVPARCEGRSDWQAHDGLLRPGNATVSPSILCTPQSRTCGAYARLPTPHLTDVSFPRHFAPRHLQTLSSSIRISENEENSKKSFIRSGPCGRKACPFSRCLQIPRSADPSSLTESWSGRVSPSEAARALFWARA